MALLWRIPDDYPNSAIGIYDKAVSMDRFLLKQGQSIELPAHRPVVRFSQPVEKLSAYECLPNNALIPLVSSRLAKALQTLCENDLQFVPARIAGSDGEIDGFSFINAINCVSAIDHSTSKYKFVPGTSQIMSFRELHFLPGSLGTHHLARDVEYKSHLLVSEEVLGILNSMRARGVELISPESIAW